MKRVLIADDEEMVRRTLKGALSTLAVEVQEAVDGQQALELALREDFDLVITDYKMPRLVGLGLLAGCRRKHPQLPFIIVSGQGPENLDRVDEVCFLQKPFSCEDLLSLVRYLLDLPS